MPWPSKRPLSPLKALLTHGCHIPARLFLLDSIIRIIFAEEYRSWSSSIRSLLQFLVNLSLYVSAGESVARGIRCCPSFYFFCPTNVSILWTTSVYIHISTAYRLYMNYRCYQMALQWNIFAQSGAVRSVDWIFIVGAPDWRYMGKYVTLDRTFYSLLLKQKAVAAQLLPHFVAYRVARGVLDYKYSNYTVH